MYRNFCSCCEKNHISYSGVSDCSSVLYHYYLHELMFSQYLYMSSLSKVSFEEVLSLLCLCELCRKEFKLSKSTRGKTLWGRKCILTSLLIVSDRGWDDSCPWKHTRKNMFFCLFNFMKEIFQDVFREAVTLHMALCLYEDRLCNEHIQLCRLCL